MYGSLCLRRREDGDLTNVILKVYGLKFAKAVMPVDYFEDG